MLFVMVHRSNRRYRFLVEETRQLLDTTPAGASLVREALNATKAGRRVAAEILR